MKLILVLSILAYGYADKLDRAYLPPVNAASSGGSPGALIAPGVQSEAFGQGLPVSGSQPSRFGPGTSQNGLSGNNQNGFGTGTIGSNYNPNVASNIPGDNKYGSQAGSNVPSGYNSQASSAIRPSYSNGFNAGNQNLPSVGSHSPSGSYNQGLQQGVQGAYAQVYRQERPQAAADRNAETLKYVNENNGESYNYNYETSNGISAEESGVATNGVMAQGGYAYTGDDGKAYSVTYTADENGYQPQGEHLPTPHPIPEEILKSIEENAKAAAAGTQEGAYRPEEYESSISPQQYNVESSGYYQPKPGQSQNQGYRGSAFNTIKNNQYQPTNQGIPEQNVPLIPSGQQYNLALNAGAGQPIYQSPIQKSSGQFNQNKGNGYQYNQPKPTVQQTVSGQGSLGQYRPQGEKSSSLSSPSFSSPTLNNNQGSFKPSFGNRPSADKSGSQQYQSGQQTVSAQSSPNRFPQNIGGSFPKQGQQNQINQAFGSQQGQIPSGQGYYYQPQQPSLESKKPNGQSTQGSQYGVNSNKPSFNSFDKQNQGTQSPFFGSLGKQNQLSGQGKQPSFGSFENSSQNSQFSHANKNNKYGNELGKRPQFNFNQAPNKISQYQQNGNQPSFGNRQPTQGSQFVPAKQGFGTNNLDQGSVSGSRPNQAPYQYNKPSQTFAAQQPDSTQLTDKRPSFGSFENPSNSQLSNTNQNAVPVNNEAGKRPQFNLNETPNKVSQYQQNGNQASYGNRQPAHGSHLSPDKQGFGANTFGQGIESGSKPDQAFNKQSTTQLPNFLPLQPQSSKGSGPLSQNKKEEFGGPRQPPSFSSQEGYKY